VSSVLAFAGTSPTVWCRQPEPPPSISATKEKQERGNSRLGPVARQRVGVGKQQILRAVEDERIGLVHETTTSRGAARQRSLNLCCLSRGRTLTKHPLGTEIETAS
jgi:hypothetical protein